MRYEAFIVGPSTSVAASGHNVRGTERGRGGRGRGGRDRGGRDAAAATEQENRMTPVNVRRRGRGQPPTGRARVRTLRENMS